MRTRVGMAVNWFVRLLNYHFFVYDFLRTFWGAYCVREAVFRHGGGRSQALKIFSCCHFSHGCRHFFSNVTSRQKKVKFFSPTTAHLPQLTTRAYFIRASCQC